MRGSFLLVAVAGLFCGSAQAQDASVIAVPICNIFAHPERFHQRTVRFHGNYATTWEGGYITEPSCETGGANKAAAILVTTADDPTLPKKYSVSWSDESWRAFTATHLCGGMEPDRTECRHGFVTADFTGLLVVKKRFRFRNGFGNGFGHLRAAKFAVLLQSVSAITPHYTDESVQ